MLLFKLAITFALFTTVVYFLEPAPGRLQWKHYLWAWTFLIGFLMSVASVLGIVWTL